MYFCDFKDLNDNSLRLEIYTQIDTVSQIVNEYELKLSFPSAITIEYEAESVFAPLKKSGASINIFTDDLLADLYTGQLLTPYVKIYKENQLIWFGFVTPNLYSQPYQKVYDNLTIECTDTLSTLANVDYTFLHNDRASTFLDVITHVLDLVDPDHVINDLYITKAVSYNGNGDVLSALGIFEQNFFDEVDNPQKCDEVLGEIMKYLGLTMMQYRDSYYIVDVSDGSTSAFIKYDRTELTKTEVTLSELTTRYVADIGVARTSGQVTLNGIYNQVSIVANMLATENPIEADTSDDTYGATLFSDLVNQNADPDHVQTINLWIDSNADVNSGIDGAWALSETDGYTHFILENSWWRSAGAWQTAPTRFYTTGSTTLVNFNGEFTFTKATERSSVAGIKQWHWQTGATWQKNMSYNADEIPSEWNFTPVLTIAAGRGRGAMLEDYVIKTERQITAYKGGVLTIDIDFARSSWPFVCNGLPETSHTYNEGDNLIFPAKLSVGNKYWNGASWKTYSDDFVRKINSGYFNYQIYSLQMTDGIYYDWPGNIYKVWNDYYHDWDYVTSSEYEAFSGTKEIEEVWHTKDAFGDATTNVTTFFIQKNGNNVQVSPDYRNQYVSDRFWLGRKFKAGDKRDGQRYKLTNTSTYRLNLNNTTEGLAIRIPDDMTLSGTFRFQMSAPRNDVTSLMPNGIIKNTMSGTAGNYYHIYSLYVKYSQINENKDIFGEDKQGNDIVYTNVINSDYVNALDDVQIRCNTYTNEIQSYSYVVTIDDENVTYINSLTYGGITKMQEEHLLDKYTNHYKRAR